LGAYSTNRNVDDDNHTKTSTKEEKSDTQASSVIAGTPPPLPPVQSFGRAKISRSTRFRGSFAMVDSVSAVPVSVLMHLDLPIELVPISGSKTSCVAVARYCILHSATTFNTRTRKPAHTCAYPGSDTAHADSGRLSPTNGHDFCMTRRITMIFFKTQVSINEGIQI